MHDFKIIETGQILHTNMEGFHRASRYMHAYIANLYCEHIIITFLLAPVINKHALHLFNILKW